VCVPVGEQKIRANVRSPWGQKFLATKQIGGYIRIYIVRL
jgi:hypothetical protein